MSKMRNWTRCWMRGKGPSTSPCSSLCLGRNSTVRDWKTNANQTNIWEQKNIFRSLSSMLLFTSQGPTLKTPYLLPSNCSTPTGRVLSTRMSKIDFSHYFPGCSYIHIFHKSIYSKIFSHVYYPGSSGCWWTRLINSPQMRFVTLFYLSLWLKLSSEIIIVIFINLQVEEAFALAPIDPTGNIDYKSLCYIITHGDEKEES